MPLINTIRPEEASGELAELYAQMIAIRGCVPNSSQMWSVSPELYKQQLSFIDYYMNHKTLSASLLACIRILVSTTTQCQYCIDRNTNMLINLLGWELNDVLALKTQGKSDRLALRENEMLRFVVEAVKNNSKADVQTLNTLRALGWSDAEILDSLQHGARMFAIDIIFNTFDIENDNL
jgi:alkylhydroperoxidase family enzyme